MIESGRDDVQCIAINDLGSPEANAHLFKYDSVHGRFDGEVKVVDGALMISKGARTWGPIKVSAQRDPSQVPFAGVDVALECTGIFTTKAKAAPLMAAGARKVLISAPADEVDATIVYGVNHGVLTKDMTVVSNASCTTNCLAPMVHVLHGKWGVLRGYMVTIHAYTGDQNTVDTLHKDLRRARAAAVSMIPTSTGAAKAVGLVLPELAGKLDGTAIRVPTPNVSLTCMTVVVSKQTTVGEVNAALEAASKGALAGILGFEHAPLVSSDYIGDPRSSIVDAAQTAVVGGDLVEVQSWYDNEWGFSHRMVDLASHLARAEK